MSEKAFKDLKIQFHMAIGIANATKKDFYPLSEFIDEDDWNAMDELQKEMFISDCANDWSENYLDLGGWVE
ncbi:hypothetical protein [Acinetobacter sp. ABJ_C5_2]|uniref:DUF7167 family protein n=1 Tax=Acinetobacter sp. ABJ_C5_2 TaxID=3376992 RepID=UPI0037C79571